MKKTIYKGLYQVLSYLSNRFDNRYLAKYKIMVGASLLMLINMNQGCRPVRASSLPPEPIDDPTEINTPPVGIEVMCYDVSADPMDEIATDSFSHTAEKQSNISGSKSDSTLLQIEEEVMCYVIIPTTPDVMPEFPGGTKGLVRYIAENIRYPKAALDSGIYGRVSVDFIVMPDGSVDSVQIRRSHHPALSEEALRLVREMPKFTPGTYKGKPVEVKYSVPVNFQLPQ